MWLYRPAHSPDEEWRDLRALFNGYRDIHMNVRPWTWIRLPVPFFRHKPQIHLSGLKNRNRC